LRAFVSYNQENWGQLLPMAQIALNNRPAASTGIAPFFLQYRYYTDPIELQEVVEDTTSMPTERGLVWVQKLQEAQEIAQAAMAVAQQQQEHYANRHREATTHFQVGDKVWLNLKNVNTTRLCKKLDWIHSKYTVTRVFENQANFYELDIPGNIHKKFHVSLLRPASNDPLPSQVTDDTQPPPTLSKEGDEEFGVEKILQARTRRIGRGLRREVLVKWAGYANPSWHPLADFQETTALDAFEERYGDAATNNGPEEGGTRRGRGG
jgi:hypothetical protein